MARSSPYRTIPWQYLGPTNVSGRSTDIAVADRAGARRIYAAYATGGLWKTDDNGATWQSIFDDYATTSIGDIAVAPSNPDIVWVGTGEANLFRASVVDYASDALVIEVTGDRGKVDALLRALEPFGIKEIAQSGLLAIGRGGKSITERVLRG